MLDDPGRYALSAALFAAVIPPRIVCFGQGAVHQMQHNLGANGLHLPLLPGMFAPAHCIAPRM